MRFLFTIKWAVEAGNASAKKDGIQTARDILAEQKPEAVYFIAAEGKRTAVMVINMDDVSELPAIAEPWFLAYNAEVDVTPAMLPEDLGKAAPAIQRAVEKYG